MYKNSSEIDTDLVSDSDDEGIDSSNDDEDLKDPFGFGDRDPFATNEQYEKDPIVCSPSAPPPISITQAKQRILACCRDLGISEENAIRYPDIQKIYHRHFGANLDKAELYSLFALSSASEVLQKDFASYLKIILAKDAEDKVMKVTARTDIRKALYDLENNVIYGIVEPIPELSPFEIEEVLRSCSRYDQIAATKTNLNKRLAKRDQVNLHKQGFAKDNFFDLPEIQNPVNQNQDDDESDVFTDDDNEMGQSKFVSLKLKSRGKYVTPADPNFGRLIPPQSLRSCPSNNSESRTSLMVQNRRPNCIGGSFLPRIRGSYLPSDDDSDIWSDEDEDHVPQFLYKDQNCEKLYREKLDVTTQPKNVAQHAEQRLLSDYGSMQPVSSLLAEFFEENEEASAFRNSSRTETNVAREEVSKHVFCQGEIQNEISEADLLYKSFENGVFSLPQGDVTQDSGQLSDIVYAFPSDVNQGREDYLEDDVLHMEENTNDDDEEGYSSEESLGFVGKHI